MPNKMLMLKSTLLAIILLVLLTIPPREPKAAPPLYPKFEFTSLDNNIYSSLGLRGRVVLISFFARGCPPCRMEVPFLNELHSKYSDILTILGVAFMENDYNELLALVKNWGIRYPVIPDPDGRVAAAFQQNLFPCAYLINHRGKFITAYKGLSAQNNREMSRKIEELMPSIAEYRAHGPAFFVGEIKNGDALDETWRIKISDWLKGRKIRVVANRTEADYIITGSLSPADKGLKMLIKILNAGMVEETRFAVEFPANSESKFKARLFEELAKYPYALR